MITYIKLPRQHDPVICRWSMDHCSCLWLLSIETQLPIRVLKVELKKVNKIKKLAIARVERQSRGSKHSKRAATDVHLQCFSGDGAAVCGGSWWQMSWSSRIDSPGMDSAVWVRDMLSGFNYTINSELREPQPHGATLLPPHRIHAYMSDNYFQWRRTARNTNHCRWRLHITGCTIIYDMSMNSIQHCSIITVKRIW